MKTGAGTRVVRPVSLNMVKTTVVTLQSILCQHTWILWLSTRAQVSIWIWEDVYRGPSCPQRWRDLRWDSGRVWLAFPHFTIPFHPTPHPLLPPSTQSPQIFYSFSSCVVTPSWRYSIFSSLNQIQFLPLSPVCKPKSVNSSTVFFCLFVFFNLMCSSSLPLIWLSVYKRTGREHLPCARYKCSHSPLINQLHLSIKTLFFPISEFQFESVFYCESRICCGSDITTWMPRKLNPFRLRIYGGCVCVVRQTVYCVYTRSEWMVGSWWSSAVDTLL